MKNLLSTIRKSKNLTQPQLAELLNMTNYQSIQAIESGRNIPSVEVALRLARALECKVEDLFELED